MSEFENSPYAAEIRRLMETGFIDGVVRQLSRKHPHMEAEIEDAIANAVLRVVTRTTTTPIKDLKGYLYRAANNGVLTAHHRASRFDSAEVDALDGPGRPSEDDVLDLEVLRSLQRMVSQWPNRNLKGYALLYLDSIRYDEPLTEVDAAEQLSELFGEPVNVRSIGQWKSRAVRQLVQDYTDHRLGEVPAASERDN